MVRESCVNVCLVKGGTVWDCRGVVYPIQRYLVFLLTSLSKSVLGRSPLWAVGLVDVEKCNRSSERDVKEMVVERVWSSVTGGWTS